MVGVRIMRSSAVALSLIAASLLTNSASAATELLSVPGTADPFLAGAPDGTACCGGDSAPFQSPVQLVSSFAPGSSFSFSAVGITDGAGTGPTGSDGAYVFNMADYGTGIAGADGVRVLGLVGVFLSDAISSEATQPSRLDFSAGLDFATFAPGLGQIFWIGDGLTGTGSGASQFFTAPDGATRLYLGTVDGSQWNNNSGSYNVTVNFAPGTSSAPEPATWALMLGGFGVVGSTMRSSRRRVAITIRQPGRTI